MEELKAYPPWRSALERITEDVEREGYGKLYSHGELKRMMDMSEPETIAEYKAHEFDYLNNMDHIKRELLVENNICLDNEYGRGYRVKTPSEQVTNVVDRQIRKAQCDLQKAKKLITHVNDTLLDIETSQLRNRKAAKIAFLEASFRKRKFTLPKSKEPALIGDKVRDANESAVGG